MYLIKGMTGSDYTTPRYFRKINSNEFNWTDDPLLAHKFKNRLLAQHIVDALESVNYKVVPYHEVEFWKTG